MGTVAKDLQNVQKSITSMEAKIDQKRSERHGILKQSKVDIHALCFTVQVIIGKTKSFYLLL